MPALNMPTSATPVNTPANPSVGKFCFMSPFSGPKGSPFDAKSYDPTSRLLVADPTNYSTGGLNTGIGFGTDPIINPTAPASIVAAGFTDDYQPGISSIRVGGVTAEAVSILTAIGGGRSNIVNGNGANGNGTPAGTNVSSPVPYNGQPLLGFGNGGSRDAGAGPAFTGFGAKTVTAVGTVAVAAAIEAGWLNRCVRSVVIGESAFGSSTAASAAVA
jgi:hypothetical protein